MNFSAVIAWLDKWADLNDNKDVPRERLVTRRLDPGSTDARGGVRASLRHLDVCGTSLITNATARFARRWPPLTVRACLCLWVAYVGLLASRGISRGAFVYVGIVVWRMI